MGWIKDLILGKEKLQPVSLNDANFAAEFINHKGPVLVDVWGPGCQPCEKLAPTIVDLCNDWNGKVKVCEMNAAAAPKAAARLGVRGTPTVVAYRFGREVGRTVGWKPKSYFDQMIETVFAVDLQQAQQAEKRAAAKAEAENSPVEPKEKSAKTGKKKP